MKQSLLFTAALLLLTTGIRAQQTLTPSERQHEIHQYLDDSTVHVPPYIFDRMLEGYQKGLSGSAVKDGKLASSSLSVDESGAAIQTVFRPRNFNRGTLYTGLNISGRGDDKFVDMFKNGKYRHTISGGLTLNFFPRFGSGKFDACNKWIAKAQVGALKSSYLQPPLDDPFDVSKQVTYLRAALETLRKYEYACVDCDSLEDIKRSADAAKSFADIGDQIGAAMKARDTLIALGYLPENYNELKCWKRREKVRDVTINAALLRQKAYLDKAEKVLINAPWTRIALHWVTLKANYNISPQPIINANKKEDDYLQSYNHEYLTFSISYNYLRKYHVQSQFQYTFSPTFSLSTARDFAGMDRIAISKTQPYTTITGDTVMQTVFSSEGYEKIAGRKIGWSIELPLVLFWGRYNWGLDIAVRAGQDNPNKDNFGGRFGVFIPVEVNDNVPVWIEPVVRVGKLFEDLPAGRSPNFWKDNVTVGFNISVALKQVTAFKK